MRARTCQNCGAEFQSRHRAARYCTRRCANTASAPRGADHPWHNGGLSFNPSLGRWIIYCRDGSQMYYYRGVVAAHIGRLLRPDELVHHLNEDSTDDRIENLEVTTRAKHIRTHMSALLAGRA